MSTKWTYEQKEAIFTTGCNLLVAAGAGAGKTAVLVERIVQKVLDKKNDIDIDNLLVVTFTNAAASEMRERIGDAISRELELNPDSKKLQRQLTLLNQANIMTIHSFCLQVIKNNFHLIDLDPNFRVCDNTESILLKQEAIQELFDEEYENNDNIEFLKLVDSYGGKSDLKLQNLVLSLYEFARSSPWSDRWLLEAAERFNITEDFDFGRSYWANILMGYIKIEVYGFKDKIQKAISIIENAEGIDYYLQPFKNDMEKIYNILSISSWNELKEKFVNLEFERLPVKRNKDADKAAKEKSKQLRDEVKKKLTDIKESIFINIDTTNDDLKELYPMMKCLVELVESFDIKYGDKKRERTLVDFSDIEHFCLNILTEINKEGGITPSEVALEYKNHFEEILIDEYQDSNEVQEVIMNMVSGKNDIPNIFMVGDVKQSVYRFRQAKPELFLNKYNTYSGKKGNGDLKIKLFKNFRSRPEIINGVNYLFKQIMSKNVGELEYDEEESLKSGAEYPQGTNVSDGTIELHLVDKKSVEVFDNVEMDAEEGIEDSEETPDSIQAEARLVAGRIKELINGEVDGKLNVFDKSINGYRPIEYRDIVILMRATANWAPTFVDELTNAGVPVFADISTGYFETIEIKTIMSLLQIVDNPMQDIPLISILRSPIETFSPEELIDIRLVNRDISFYEALKAVSIGNIIRNNASNEEIKYDLSHINEELIVKVREFLKRLDNWRKILLHMNIDEFIWYVYTETGYYGFVGAMIGGKQRQANLRMLFQRAKQFEKTSYKGLFNFINFINKLKNSSGDMGSAKIIGENEDVVRIMSIHKSKGLEFPVVILAGCGKNFNLMDMNRNILFHAELGLGPDYVDINRRISYNTLVKQALKKKLKIETLSEEMRILYVAFTRAKEKLIVTGIINDINKTAEKWCTAASYESSKIPEYAVINAKNYLDWIGPALVRHPSGKPLREYSEKEAILKSLMEEQSKWDISIWNKENFKIDSDIDKDEDIVKELENADLNCNLSEYKEDIDRRLNWQYKYKEACSIPNKFSVSELKRKFALVDTDESRTLINETSLKKPIFLQEAKKLSSAERGTLMHFVMQHIELNKANSKEEIKQQIRQLVTKDFITEEESKVIKIDKIYNFFQCSLGARMKNSKKFYREVPFFIEMPSIELYKDLPKEIYKDEKVIIQGVIDCYFEEDDGLVLLDYKTDFVDNIEEIKEKYALQIYYYSIALERITGKSVKNKYIYLFFKDKTLEM